MRLTPCATLVARFCRPVVGVVVVPAVIAATIGVKDRRTRAVEAVVSIYIVHVERPPATLPYQRAVEVSQ